MHFKSRTSIQCNIYTMRSLFPHWRERGIWRPLCYEASCS